MRGAIGAGLLGASLLAALLPGVVAARGIVGNYGECVTTSARAGRGPTAAGSGAADDRPERRGSKVVGAASRRFSYTVGCN